MKSNEYKTSEMLEGFRELISGSEISCVLIGASMIDKSLEDLLKDHFRIGSTSERMLKSDTGLLGNLRTKADCAYVLKLIEKNIYQNILWVLEIRNVFGHNHVKCSFADEKIISIGVNNKHALIDPSNSDLFHGAFEKIGVTPSEKNEDLSMFRSIVYEIVKYLRNAIKSASLKKEIE